MTKATARKKPGPTSANRAATVTDLKPSRGTPPDLRTILSDIRVNHSVKKEIKRIVMYLYEATGEVTGPDIAQIRELAAISGRQRDAEQMAAEAKDAGDVDGWMRLCRILDGLTTQRRGLMRDLRVTRMTQTEGGESASEKKARQKSGSKWSGIL